MTSQTPGDMHSCLKLLFLRSAITIIFLMHLGETCFSQQPEQVLNQWAAKSPIEKLYFHLDRDDYIAGQTIWFKVYAYSDFLPSGKTTDLFVELYNSSAVMVNRQALPLFGGFAHGQIELPDTLPGGLYLLRAYTATMLNHEPEFLYKKTFIIFNKNKTRGTAEPGVQAARLEFFPEGGSFVSGLSNSIAFKATNEKGFPVDVSGFVKNEKGETVAEFTSYHDGMGNFDLAADPNTTYYAVLKNDPTGKKYYLPVQSAKGIVFRVISSGITKSYEILQQKGDPVFKAAYMIGQIQHHVVFRKIFSDDNDDLTGIIPTNKLSSGILQLTVFNKNGLPLAERLTFVDNREYIQAGDILTDTLDFSARKKNHFTLALKDTVQGSFSISITDPAFDLAPVRNDNIYSGLLLTSDLNGYVHNPSYYFSDVNDSIQNALDLVMMTNGWRRFKWSALLKEPVVQKKYSDPGYITLSGKINLESTKKPFADKDLLIFIVSAFGKNMQMVHTDANGSFSFDSIVFYGNARILFTDIKGKKSKFISVKLDGDSLYHPYAVRNIGMRDFSAAGPVPDRDQKMIDDYNAIMRAEGLVLENVTVKARRKSELEEVEEKYVSGLFAGSANSTLDLTKENMMGYRDIFDYLKMRVPGLQILTDPSEPGYVVRYRQTAAVSSMGELPMTIFLNEVPSDADAISSIPPYEIALVKVFSTFVGATGNGAGGVLAIYTKKDADLRSLPAPGDLSDYRGFSIVREFYSPDYSVVKDQKTDQRITLFWKPDILVDGVSPRIPVTFYNNDRTKRFKVVAEGMTADGKFLMIEKIIGGKKAF